MVLFSTTANHERSRTYLMLTILPSLMQRMASCNFSRPHPKGNFLAEITLPFLSSSDGSFSAATSAPSPSSLASPLDQVMRADDLKHATPLASLHTFNNTILYHMLSHPTVVSLYYKKVMLSYLHLLFEKQKVQTEILVFVRTYSFLS